MEKLLISACFLKEGYKYDGKSNMLSNDVLDKLKEKYELVLICPEVLGGLSVPRKPSEIKNGLVLNNEGKDLTSNFINGSNKSLELANGCKKALLKAKSPSCGYKQIYDGTFTHNLTNGNGVFVDMLLKNTNIEIYNENEIEKLL